MQGGLGDSGLLLLQAQRGRSKPLGTPFLEVPLVPREEFWTVHVGVTLSSSFLFFGCTAGENFWAVRKRPRGQLEHVHGLS